MKVFVAATALGLALLTQGCMTSGTMVSMEAVQTLQPGVSTRADAERVLGAPNSISAMPDGGVLLQWIGVTATMFGADSRHVALRFDRQGKYLGITHQNQSTTY